VHAPSAASLGVYAALHMRMNSKERDVGKDELIVVRVVVLRCCRRAARSEQKVGDVGLI